MSVSVVPVSVFVEFVLSVPSVVRSDVVSLVVVCVVVFVVLSCVVSVVEVSVAVFVVVLSELV